MGSTLVGLPGRVVEYTVNPSQSGTYTLEFRVASAGAGGTFHIEVNGVDRTGPISIPNTHGWQNWSTVTRSGVNLSSGTQTWRLVVDDVGGGGNVGNFNYIRATVQSGTSTSSAPTAVHQPLCRGSCRPRTSTTAVKAVPITTSTPPTTANRTRSTGVDVESTSDAGGGYNVGDAFAGEWLNYTVNVAAAGNYDIEVRVASAGSGGSFHIEANGVNKTGAFVVPYTGGWQTWTTIRKTGIALPAGQQVLKLVMDAEGSRAASGTSTTSAWWLEPVMVEAVEVDRRRIQAPPWHCPARCSSRPSTMAVRAWRSTTCLRRTPAVRSAQPASTSNQPSIPVAATTSASPSRASGSPTR